MFAASQGMPTTSMLNFDPQSSRGDASTASPSATSTGTPAQWRRRVIFPSLYALGNHAVSTTEVPPSLSAPAKLKPTTPRALATTVPPPSPGFPRGSACYQIQEEDDAIRSWKLDHLLPRIEDEKSLESVPTTRSNAGATITPPTTQRTIVPVPGEDSATSSLQRFLQTTSPNPKQHSAPFLDNTTDCTTKKRLPKPSLLRSSSSTSTTSTCSSSSTPPTPRRSIIMPISSIASDLPSLASTATLESEDELEGPCLLASSNKEGPRVSFDSRVCVRVFADHDEKHHAKWYSEEEMKEFKMEAMKMVLKYNTLNNCTELMPTGTGRMVQRYMPPQQQQQNQGQAKVLFSHEALRLDVEQCAAECRPPTPPKQAEEEERIRKVLIVDHDICLALLQKSFQVLLPKAEICTCSSSSDALDLVAQQGPFDIIVVEERLKQQQQQQVHDDEDNIVISGSILLRKLAAEASSSGALLPLLIGVSAHLDQDEGRLVEHGGADVVWSKPPPTMNEALLGDLVQRLLRKRGDDTK